MPALLYGKGRQAIVAAMHNYPTTTPEDPAPLMGKGAGYLLALETTTAQLPCQIRLP